MYKKWGKRLLDISLGSVLLIVSMPIIILVGIILAFDTGWPVIFRQERLGRHGKIIRVLKFRTLHGIPSSTHTSHEECAKRASAIGRYLRRHSLDEFIQLPQVLTGTLSIVGPRPKVEDYVRLQAALPSEQQRIFSATPGLTGLSQVSISRKDCDRYPQSVLRADLEYIEKCCLRYDLWLIVRTMIIIFQGK